MHTLDQLSDDRYATWISQLFARNRSATNQLLAGYFAANNNTALASQIKKAAKSMLQSQDTGDEPMGQAVMTDPHILSNFALFLPNRHIVPLELLCRRTFISLRKYPAIHGLDCKEIDRYLWHSNKYSLTIDMGRFRNVRTVDIHSDAITKLIDCSSNAIFKKVERSEAILKCKIGR